MRLDKFLKTARIIKRRTVANSISNSGRVKVNDQVAKPAQSIRPGDVIEIAFGSGNVKVEVLAVRENVKKKDVTDLYRIIGSSKQETLEIDEEKGAVTSDDEALEE